MRKARLFVVILLVGTGLGGAYFGVGAQEGRSPWPPRPIVPPDIDGKADVPEPVVAPPKKTETPAPPIFPTDPRAQKRVQEPPPPLPTPTPVANAPGSPRPAAVADAPGSPRPAPVANAPGSPLPKAPASKLPKRLNDTPEAMPDPAFP